MAALPDIDFNITLQRSDLGTSAIVAVDPNDYPPGTDVTLKGYFLITQPDGITVTTGSFLSPSIYWNGSALTQGNFELRLRSNGSFQQGEYTFEYHAIATGYDEAVLTKTVTLSYTSPTLVFDPNLDFFTPVLNVADDTDYAQGGMALISVSRAWEATIISVEGTNQDINSTASTFDLSYLGNYYDAEYNVTLTSTVTYTLNSPDDFLTIIDVLQLEATYDSQIPPTLIELLALITALKTQLDDGGCICGSGCSTTCTPLKNSYTLAVSLYTHIVERGREGVTADLGPYVIQLVKLLNNCVTPDYEHTNEAIPPYDWGGGSGGGSFAFFKQMIVGSGTGGAPVVGATTYTDALLIGKQVQVFISGILMPIGLNFVQSITYDSSTGTITWLQGLNNFDIISIYTY